MGLKPVIGGNVFLLERWGTLCGHSNALSQVMKNEFFFLRFINYFLHGNSNALSQVMNKTLFIFSELYKGNYKAI